MKILLLIFGLIVAVNALNAGDLDAYRLYNTSGEIMGYDEMVNALKEADIVLFGNCMIILLHIGWNWKLVNHYMKLCVISWYWEQKCLKQITS